MKISKLTSTQKRTNGFTVVELLIVIAVIVILVGVTAVAYRGAVARSTNARIVSDLSNAAEQLEIDFLNDKLYPVTLAASNNGKGVKGSSGTQFTYSTSSARKLYCLSATSADQGAKVYYVTGDTEVKEGTCTTPVDTTPVMPPSGVAFTVLYSGMTGSLHSNGTQATINFPNLNTQFPLGYDLWSCTGNAECNSAYSIAAPTKGKTYTAGWTDAWQGVEPSGTGWLVNIPAGTTMRFVILGYDCYDPNNSGCGISNVVSVTRP